MHNDLYNFKPCPFCGGKNIQLFEKRNCIGHGEYTVSINIECMSDLCGFGMGIADYAEKEKEVLETIIIKWNTHPYRNI